MVVKVVREPSEKDWTLSKFYFDDKEMGVGVEDEYREKKIKGETCIPNGIYKMGMRMSPHFSYYYYRDEEGNLIDSKSRTTIELQKKYYQPHELIWVKDVPGFEYVLWHWGNSDDDTDGCYIVGSFFATLKGQEGVAASKKKYEEIYPILYRAIKNEEVMVEYSQK